MMKKRCSIFLPIILISLIVFSSLYSPYTKSYKYENIKLDNIVLRNIHLLPELLDSSSSLSLYLDNFLEIDKLIPDSARVSSGEAINTLLWRKKAKYLFPMGIEYVDYVILRVDKQENGYLYSGAFSYLGDAEAKKLINVFWSG